MTPEEHYARAERALEGMEEIAADYRQDSDGPLFRELASIGTLSARLAEVGHLLRDDEPEWEERGLTEDRPQPQTQVRPRSVADVLRNHPVGKGTLLVGDPSMFWGLGRAGEQVKELPGFAASDKTHKAGCTCGDPGYCRCTHLPLPDRMTPEQAAAARGETPKADDPQRCEARTNPGSRFPEARRCLLDKGHQGWHECEGDDAVFRWLNDSGVRPALKADGTRLTEAPDGSSVTTGVPSLTTRVGQRRCESEYLPPDGGDALRCDIPEGHACDHEAWAVHGNVRFLW